MEPEDPLLITPTIFNGPQSMLQRMQVFQGLGQSNSLLKVTMTAFPVPILHQLQTKLSEWIQILNLNLHPTYKFLYLWCYKCLEGIKG